MHDVMVETEGLCRSGMRWRLDRVKLGTECENICIQAIRRHKFLHGHLPYFSRLNTLRELKKSLKEAVLSYNFHNYGRGIIFSNRSIPQKGPERTARRHGVTQIYHNFQLDPFCFQGKVLRYWHSLYHVSLPPSQTRFLHHTSLLPSLIFKSTL